MADYLSDIILASNHIIVISDNIVEKVYQKNLQKLEMTFRIDYKGIQDNPAMLTLIINPENMNISLSKKISNNFGRNGYIVEDWGEFQDIIACSGRIGGYYVKNPSIGFSGLNRIDRRKSASFQNLMNLFLIYRNNGLIYNNVIKNTEANKPKLIQSVEKVPLEKKVRETYITSDNKIEFVGDLYMYYDNTIYLGSFDEFIIEENSNAPFTLSYSFKFTVQKKSIVNKKPYYFDEFTINNFVDDKFINKYKKQKGKIWEDVRKITKTEKI